MSLESQVAALVTAAGENLKLPGQIADTARQQIAAVSQAYQTAIATADIQRFVDQVLGNDDKNSGLNAQSPYKTFDRALADCTPNGIVTVILLSNYTLDHNVKILNRRLRVATANLATRTTLTFTKYAIPAENVRAVTRFACEGDTTVSLLNQNIILPNTDGYTALARDFRSAIIGPPDGVSDSIFTRQAVSLLGCDLAIPSNNFGAVVSGTLMQLFLSYTTASISPLLGRLVEKYQNTSGTPAAEAPDIFTNLARI